ncbi:MAG TPA: hypothetical protein VK980_18355, partial [Sphingomonas sp.]|nr:hypothetical protein [Sphingomonas sp.]
MTASSACYPYHYDDYEAPPRPVFPPVPQHPPAWRPVRHGRKLSPAWFATATALGGVLGAPAGASDGAPPTPAIRAAAPAGFDQLLAPQHGVVDVWFGGKRVGQAEAVFAPGEFRFV